MHVVLSRTVPKSSGEAGVLPIVPPAMNVIFTAAGNWTRRLPIPAGAYAPDRSGKPL